MHQIDDRRRVLVLLVAALGCALINVLAFHLVYAVVGEGAIAGGPVGLLKDLIQLSPYWAGLGLCGFGIALVTLRNADLIRAIPLVIGASMLGSLSPIWMPVFGDFWGLGVAAGFAAGVAAMVLCKRRWPRRSGPVSAS